MSILVLPVEVKAREFIPKLFLISRALRRGICCFIGDKVAVNRFIRYEDNLKDQINPILKLHDIPEISMDTFEKQHRPKDIHPENIFSKDQMSLIQQEWKWEFDNLGYNK